MPYTTPTILGLVGGVLLAIVSLFQREARGRRPTLVLLAGGLLALIVTSIALGPGFLPAVLGIHWGPRPYRAHVQASEYAPVGGAGTGVIHGQAPGEATTVFHVGDVILRPVTSVSQEWWGRVIRHKDQPEQSTIPTEYDRLTRTDEYASFELDSLPQGRYYLVVPNATYPHMGMMVTIGRGETLRVRLPPIH